PAAGELHERGVVAPALARQRSKEIGELDAGVGRSRQADLAREGRQELFWLELRRIAGPGIIRHQYHAGPTAGAPVTERSSRTRPAQPSRSDSLNAFDSHLARGNGGYHVVASNDVEQCAAKITKICREKSLHRSHLAGFGVIAEAGRIRHADKLVFDDGFIDLQRLRHQRAQLIRISPVSDNEIFRLTEAVGSWRKRGARERRGKSARPHITFLHGDSLVTMK